MLPFLKARRKEVVDIMELLFSQDEIWEMTKREIEWEGRREGQQKGEQQRDVLYGKLIEQLLPLGRIDELPAATRDRNKLSALANEFGLEI